MKKLSYPTCISANIAICLTIDTSGVGRVEVQAFSLLVNIPVHFFFCSTTAATGVSSSGVSANCERRFLRIAASDAASSSILLMTLLPASKVPNYKFRVGNSIQFVSVCMCNRGDALLAWFLLCMGDT